MSRSHLISGSQLIKGHTWSVDQLGHRCTSFAFGERGNICTLHPYKYRVQALTKMADVWVLLPALPACTLQAGRIESHGYLPAPLLRSSTEGVQPNNASEGKQSEEICLTACVCLHALILTAWNSFQTSILHLASAWPEFSTETWRPGHWEHKQRWIATCYH